MSKVLPYTGIVALAVVLAVIAWPEDPPPAAEQARPDSAFRDSSTVTSDPKRQGTIADTDIEIDELRRRLEDEIRARRALERRLQDLEGEIAILQAAASAAMSADSDTAAAGQDDAPGEDGQSRAWFDEQALVASGLDETSARELRLFFEQLELERLRLRDRATREGWDSARTRDEFTALEDRESSLRERLGDEGYAAYLYAAGRSNRVEVTNVLASAPAGQAGIQAGDQILRYGDERIYSPRELRSAIADGDIGDLVEVEVEREGESLRFYLSRGPLGVRTSSLSVAP